MIRSSKDFCTGLIYMFFGVSAILVARDYAMGTGVKMGPAYFPTILGGLLSAIGGIAVIRSFIVPGTPIGAFTLNDRFKAPAAGSRGLIPFGMPLTVRPGNFLLGTRQSGRQLAFVCYAGTQMEDIEATFAPGMPLPIPLRPTSIDNPSFS